MTTIRRPVRRSRKVSRNRTAAACVLMCLVALILLVWPSRQSAQSKNLRQPESPKDLGSVLSRSHERRGTASAGSSNHGEKRIPGAEQDLVEENVPATRDEQETDQGEHETKEDTFSLQDPVQSEALPALGDSLPPVEHKHGYDVGEGLPSDLPDEDQTSSEIHGNHVTLKSYVADYHHDRDHPGFLDPSGAGASWEGTSATHVKSLLEKLLPGDLKPCRYWSDDRRLVTHAACNHSLNRTIVAYNGQPFERTWCGTTIAPFSAAEFDYHCGKPVRLLPMSNPPVSGAGMPPIVIHEHKDAKTRGVACDIPCQEETGMKGTMRYIQGTNWTIIQSMADPAEDGDVRVESSAFRQDRYYSTTSFKSNVPLSFFSFENYDISKVPALDYDDAEPSASYLIDEKCNPASSKRHRWAAAVANNYPVAHYGSCEHDTDLPKGMSLANRQDRVKLHQKHLFNLAFEAGTEKDHITSVTWEAFKSGSVPVLLGPSNLKKHLPKHSFISCGDFQQWDQLGKYIAGVAANRTLWESYHEWRRDQSAVVDFKKRYEFTLTSPSCRLCRWAYSKKYGLGWDHEKQIIQESTVPRELCVDPRVNLVHQPFLESWAIRVDGRDMQVTAATATQGSCQQKTTPTVDAVGVTIYRNITIHDGVVDILVSEIWRHGTEGDLVLHMEFPVENQEGASFPDSHIATHASMNQLLCRSVSIQDDRARISVLADWETDVHCVGKGTIEITVLSDIEPKLDSEDRRRIRIIVEGVDSLSDKITEFYPSSFGQLATNDFVSPLELYFVESR